MRQSSYIPQNNVEWERERIDVLAECRLAICKADSLHVQQRAGWVVQNDESIQDALLGGSFLQARTYHQV